MEAVSLASSGLPGAGYCTSNNSLGNPPKSCIVSGKSIAVIFVPRLSQWAETTNIAFGVGISFASFAQLSLNWLCSIPFMGEPWPINKTGIRLSCFFRLVVNFLKSDNVVILKNPFYLFIKIKSISNGKSFANVLRIFRFINNGYSNIFYRYNTLSILIKNGIFQGASIE